MVTFADMKKAKFPITPQLGIGADVGGPVIFCDTGKVCDTLSFSEAVEDFLKGESAESSITATPHNVQIKKWIAALAMAKSKMEKHLNKLGASKKAN